MSATPTWLERAHTNAGWIVALGVLQMIAGGVALAAPLAGGVVTTILIGSGLLVAGIAGVVAAFHAGSFGAGALGFIWALVLGAAGLSFVFNPGLALATLTLVAAAMFFVSGIGQVLTAVRMRPVRGWGWMMFGGALGVVMAFMVWRQFPFSGLWFIGTLVGIQLLFSGVSTLMVGGLARGVTAAPPAPAA